MPEPKIDRKRWDVEAELELLDELPDPPSFDPEADAEPFTIDTPPPYPSGTWHIGAVAHYSLIDMIARSRRMMGYDVLFPWGVDRNGINIEFVVEKKHKKKLQEWDREAFIAACEKEIEETTADLETIAQRVALSCDFEDRYETDSDAYRAASQAAFIELWNDGQIVEDLRPNNFDPELGTTIADAEVYYSERETDLVHVRWETSAGEDVVIATTRPELICACQQVLVHPDDDRYDHLVGESARLPLFDREVPIDEHASVDPEFGSGVVMICSYGDQHDVQLFRELDLEPVKAIDTDARMTEAAGPYEGMKVADARRAVVEDLEDAGRVEDKERIQQAFPISERSKAPVEIVLLEEWYLKQTHVLDTLRERAHEMDFHPDKHRQLLLDWIDNVTIDWPISRRRYYHTEIPVWTCADCGHAQVPEPGPYYRPWKEDPPFDACEECGHDTFEGEEKVFDTWMDSSISNLYILGYPDLDEDLFPTSIRPQGRDIVRTWLYYATLKSQLLEDSRPFDHVWITGLGMDEHGRKMSKSLGNIIHPDEVLDEHGADAFRFWIASEATIGDDFRISEDRIAGAKKFLTKLFNVARFISMFDPPKERPASLRPVDEWILAEFDAAHERAMAGYEEFDFFHPANAIRDFVWNLFAPHYMEMVKSRAYDGDEAAIWTLHEALERAVELLAPIAPVITYGIADRVWDHNVHDERFPGTFGVTDRTDLTEDLVAFNSKIWKQKKDAGMSLAEDIEGVEVPDELAPFADELVEMHGLVDG